QPAASRLGGAAAQLYGHRPGLVPQILRPGPGPPLDVHLPRQLLDGVAQFVAGPLDLPAPPVRPPGAACGSPPPPRRARARPAPPRAWPVWPGATARGRPRPARPRSRTARP